MSVGPYDHVKPALRTLGVRELFWRIALQPGKPAWAGEAGGRIVIALPGNPLSVLAGFELLVRPVIRRLARDERARAAAPAASALRAGASPARSHARGALGARALRRSRPLGAGLSHQLGRAALADVLALVPAGGADAAVGELVDVVSLA